MAQQSSYDFSIFDVLTYYDWQLPPPRGRWQKIRCQSGSHDDTNPSASISQVTNRIHCFACGFAGDAIDIIGHYEPELTFVERVRRAESITGTSGEALRAADRRGGRVPVEQGDPRTRRRYTAPRRRSGTAGRA